MSIWTDMFVIQIPIAEKILRTVLVYLVILVLFRVAGKRGMAALNTFDFVVLFLLSNIVQNAVIGNDNSLVGGVVGAISLVVVNAALNRLAVWHPRLALLLEGRPTTVIEEGHLDKRTLRRLAVRPGDLEFAVRLQNGDSVNDIQHGALEPGGHLVLTMKHEAKTATGGDIAGLAERLERIERLLAGVARG